MQVQKDQVRKQVWPREEKVKDSTISGQLYQAEKFTWHAVGVFLSPAISRAQLMVTVGASISAFRAVPVSPWFSPLAPKVAKKVGVPIEDPRRTVALMLVSAELALLVEESSAAVVPVTAALSVPSEVGIAKAAAGPGR